MTFFSRIFRSALVLILVGFFLSSAALAQSRRHDLSASFGIVTLDQVSDILEDVVNIVISLGTYSKSNMEFSGAPFLTYHFSPQGRLGFGLALGTYSTEGDLQSGIGEPGTFKERNSIGALEVDYRWILRRSFQLYSGVGLGLRLRHGTYATEGSTETLNKTLPTFHLNVLGFRFGGTIGFFGELGMGYKGMLSLGLNAQF
jgi:hypothetical protein